MIMGEGWYVFSPRSWAEGGILLHLLGILLVSQLIWPLGRSLQKKFINASSKCDMQSAQWVLVKSKS